MIVDADAHVEESAAMFEHLDTEFYPRPSPFVSMKTLSLANTTPYGSSMVRPIPNSRERAERFFVRQH